MTYEYVVDTMGDDVVEAMEWQNGKVYIDSDSSFGEEHKMDNDTYSLSNALEQNTIYYIYIWIAEPTDGEKYHMKGNNPFYLP